MKTDKGLAVELASAALYAVSNHNANLQTRQKPISGDDIDNILKNCYQSIRDLDSGE